MNRWQWSEDVWQDVAGAGAAGRIAVLPVAAIEQHGPHLPLGTDAMIMEGYLARVFERLPDDIDVRFLPTLAIGTSERACGLSRHADAAARNSAAGAGRYRRQCCARRMQKAGAAQFPWRQ